MEWIWVGLAVLIVIAGIRYRRRLRKMRSTSHIDDAAIHEIIRTGRLPRRDGDEPMDLRAAAKAEEDFWDESWDQPEEFRS